MCKLVENARKLPIDSFTTDDIAKIIINLNPNKAHGFDMISIHMLKICGDSVLKPYF